MKSQIEDDNKSPTHNDTLQTPFSEYTFPNGFALKLQGHLEVESLRQARKDENYILRGRINIPESRKTQISSFLENDKKSKILLNEEPALFRAAKTMLIRYEELRQRFCKKFEYPEPSPEIRKDAWRALISELVVNRECLREFVTDPCRLITPTITSLTPISELPAKLDSAGITAKQSVINASLIQYPTDPHTHLVESIATYKSLMADKQCQRFHEAPAYIFRIAFSYGNRAKNKLLDIADKEDVIFSDPELADYHGSKSLVRTIAKSKGDPKQKMLDALTKRDELCKDPRFKILQTYRSLILEAFFTHVHSGVEKHLEKVVANVDYLLTTKKFSPLNLSTTDAIRIASKTTKSLKGKADKILSTFNEILSDPDFADLHETPKLVVASICNHPKDPKKFLTDALLKEQTILGQEEFSHLVNNKWLVRLAAFSHPNTTEDFLGKVWRVYNVLKDDPELKLFQKRNKILLEAAANLSSTDEKAMKIEAKEILLASQKRYLELLRNPACADLLKNKSFLLRLAFSNREDPLGAVNTILSNIQSIKDDAAYKHFHHLPKIIELACFRSMRDPHSYLDALTQRLNKVYGNKETQKGALRFAQIKPYFPKKSSLAA